MKLIQKNNYKYGILGFLGLMISIALIIFYSDFLVFFVNFGEKYLSPDNHISVNTIRDVKVLLIIIIIFLSAISILIFTKKMNPFLEATICSSNFPIDINKASKFFFTDNICSKTQLSVYLFAVGTFLSINIHLYVLLFERFPKEGALETISTLIILFAAVLLLFSSFQLNRLQFHADDRKKIKFILTAISGIFLFLFGEEVSWGQHFFGWESFGIFKEYNFQSETNSHNFLNPLFTFIYPTIGIGGGVLLFLIWLFPNIKKTPASNLLVPHPSLFPVVLMMACSTFIGSSENYEQLFSIFVLLYSLRILISIRYPGFALYLREKH